MIPLRLIAVAVIAGALAAPVNAHSVVIYTGRVYWEGSELRLELDFDAHLLEHESRAAGRTMSAKELAQQIAASFHLVTESGRPIDFSRVSNPIEKTGATVLFSMPADVTALAVVYEPVESFTAMPRQFQIRWAPGGSSQARMIRLMSDPNYAVLLRDQPSEDAGAPFDRFSGPALQITTQDRPSPSLVLDVPCILLPVLANLPLDGETVSTSWLRRRRDSIMTWLESSLTFADPQGGRVPTAAQEPYLLGPHDEVIRDSKQAFGVLTTRVRMIIKSAPSRQISKGTVTWRGYNAAVLRLPVTVGQDAHWPIAELTPAQNTLWFDLTDPRHATWAPLAAHNARISPRLENQP